MMTWPQLLSRARLGKPGSREERGRSEFQRDFDRIVFSSPFRRLQDKTQVFPLAQTDYVRTRLTHSLEASCVGRSLGTLVGAELITRHPELAAAGFNEADLGAVVAAACLAHDIGNPPFGHAGEAAIQEWFLHDPRGQRRLIGLTPQQRADFERFEGNAQGFRILCRLQGEPEAGGMRLTYATLAAFTKYPRAAHLPVAPGQVSSKKHGFFAADVELFERVAEATGLLARGDGRWARHPFAFLVEAADDICYRIIDAEDGVHERLIPFELLRELLLTIIDDPQAARRADGMPQAKAVEYLRAAAMGAAIRQVTAHFLTVEEALLAGEYERELTAEIPAQVGLAQLQQAAREHVYTARPVLEVEAAGFNVLGELIDRFVGALEQMAEGESGQQRHRVHLGLIPEPYRQAEQDPYLRLLAVTDFVSGMTDSSAVATYQRLLGIALPG